MAELVSIERHQDFCPEDFARNKTMAEKGRRADAAQPMAYINYNGYLVFRDGVTRHIGLPMNGKAACHVHVWMGTEREWYMASTKHDLQYRYGIKTVSRVSAQRLRVCLWSHSNISEALCPWFYQNRRKGYVHRMRVELMTVIDKHGNERKQLRFTENGIVPGKQGKAKNGYDHTAEIRRQILAERYPGYAPTGEDPRP